MVTIHLVKNPTLVVSFQHSDKTPEQINSEEEGCVVAHSDMNSVDSYLVPLFLALVRQNTMVRIPKGRGG